MNFPTSVLAEDMDLFLKECRLTGYYVELYSSPSMWLRLPKLDLANTAWVMEKTWIVAEYWRRENGEWYQAGERNEPT